VTIFTCGGSDTLYQILSRAQRMTDANNQLSGRFAGNFDLPTIGQFRGRAIPKNN